MGQAPHAWRPPQPHHGRTMSIADRIASHLEVLVEGIGARPPGSPANRRATDYLVDTLGAAGLAVEALPFSARWWEPGPAWLDVDGVSVPVDPAPFSRPCDVAGRVRRLSRATELAAAEPDRDSILVIDGELTIEPLFPKAFPFLDLPEQRATIGHLERLRSQAIVAVVESRGANSFFEDPDLEFPYLVVDRPVGYRLRQDMEVGVRIGGRLDEGPGINVAARIGALSLRAGGIGGPGAGSGSRMVVSAHVDSKVTTPGAFDNAGGVAALLTLAELLGQAERGIARAARAAPVELVFFNGEDHYAAPGEQAWLAAAELSTVSQVINVDGAGVAGRGTTVAPLACPPDIEQRLETVVARRPGWTVVPPWYESDHSIFAMRGIPSLAITSDDLHGLLADVAHTERDTLDIVDPVLLAGVVDFIDSWLRETAPSGES